MQINITGHQVEVTDALKDYASEKIGRVEKHFDRMTTTNIVLHVEKTRHMAEATVNAKGATIHANAEGKDMYAAIDALSDKLDRQVIKHKEKTTDHHRDDGRAKKNAAI
ncbi:MAG: ribosome-associated translation inhibitor RaiA [Gammaproteobacteria bacterium]|nr:MAG: ribosome-associated translation inhibitor RaiA [Gammaproteobacteria bacterium]